MDIFQYTPNQEQLVCSILEKTLTVCHGPAGTGKTLVTLKTAVSQLQQRKVDQIVLTRSMVSCGKDFPSLPGDLDEKVGPYMTTYLDYLQEMFQKEELGRLLHQKKILIQPIELLRGQTYHNAILVADEAQNISPQQLKMYITRAGKNSKIVVVGDKTQKDTRYEDNGLMFCHENFTTTDKCGVVTLTYDDIKRNSELADIIRVFDDANY